MHISFDAYSAEEFLAIADFCKAIAAIKQATPNTPFGLGRIEPSPIGDAIAYQQVKAAEAEQPQGVMASNATPESDADPQNPNVPAEEQPKRKRRTKAEMEADAAKEAEAANTEAEADFEQTVAASEPEILPPEPANDEERVFTIDDVTKAIQDLSEKFTVNHALALLGVYGAKSRKTLAEDKREAFVRKAEAALASGWPADVKVEA